MLVNKQSETTIGDWLPYTGRLIREKKRLIWIVFWIMTPSNLEKYHNPDCRFQIAMSVNVSKLRNIFQHSKEGKWRRSNGDGGDDDVFQN
jgi:hypothetical protein